MQFPCDRKAGRGKEGIGPGEENGSGYLDLLLRGLPAGWSVEWRLYRGAARPCQALEANGAHRLAALRMASNACETFRVGDSENFLLLSTTWYYCNVSDNVTRVVSNGAGALPSGTVTALKEHGACRPGRSLLLDAEPPWE